MFPKWLKKVVIKSRVDDDNDDYVNDDNSDHGANSIALLPRLPTSLVSYLLVFTLLYSSFMPLH